jgi:hypothetical protein
VELVAFVTQIFGLIFAILLFLALPVWPASALGGLPADFVIVQLPYPQAQVNDMDQGYYELVAKVDASSFLASGPSISGQESSVVKYEWLCYSGDVLFNNACYRQVGDGANSAMEIVAPAAAVINVAYDMDGSDITNEQLVLFAQIHPGLPFSTGGGLESGENKLPSRARYVCPGPPAYTATAPTACTT